MPTGDEAVVIEQAGAGQIGVDVRGVSDIVALLLEPGHIIDFIVEEGAVAIEGDRPVEGNLDCALRPQRGQRRRAVVVVQALACQRNLVRRTGRDIVGPVVVRRVGVEGDLIKQWGIARVVAHREEDVVLIAGGVDELDKVHTADPGRRDGELVAGCPVAGEEPRRAVHGTAGLDHPR